ncbi:hypothetical protein [Piscinibacter koreensis]|uniref:Uncharacterized protein n=1 Tax=Piscinibacter koreensis TaxID=2742824 RepID=A0A7Y6NT52_9BURK|nr:hypothetical protein [Schlegelella koreensis]NUZ08851.1 hypothetical protein [Schlegelella koreensis]
MTTDTLVIEPSQRKLRIFALNPSLAAQFGMESIAELTIRVPWEADLRAGPVGEYVEVVDVDPASGALYKPVDLNDPRVLAQDGLAPSETNPQFHQQMAYAVAMSSIVHFEQALGRRALWAPHRESNNDGSFRSERFVRRLRIYPHALRDQNAYYSPQKKALLFGYFPTGLTDENNTKDTLVFTSLSHDIIAHETTHALLDGVHPRFNLPVNRDVLAFHEAFADIVALFQRFSYPGVLRHQIAKTRTVRRERGGPGIYGAHLAFPSRAEPGDGGQGRTRTRGLARPLALLEPADRSGSRPLAVIRGTPLQGTSRRSADANVLSAELAANVMGWRGPRHQLTASGRLLAATCFAAFREAALHRWTASEQSLAASLSGQKPPTAKGGLWELDRMTTPKAPAFP